MSVWSLKWSKQVHYDHLLADIIKFVTISFNPGLIRSEERYDLVKIKPTELGEEHWLGLWLCRLWSSENRIVGVASRSGRITDQSQCSIPGLVIGWFFRFCFRLRQLSFHWVISDGVVNGTRRNGNVLILPTPISSSLLLRLWLQFSGFSLGHKLSYDSDSVPSEYQP